MVPVSVPVSAAIVFCRGRDGNGPLCRCRRRTRARRLSHGVGSALLAVGALTAVSWSTGASSTDAAGSRAVLSGPAAPHRAARQAAALHATARHAPARHAPATTAANPAAHSR